MSRDDSNPRTVHERVLMRPRSAIRRVLTGLCVAVGIAGVAFVGLAFATSGTYTGITDQVDPNPQTAYVMTITTMGTRIASLVSGENLTCKHSSADLPGDGNSLSEIEVTLSTAIPIRYGKFDGTVKHAHDVVHIEGQLKGKTITGFFTDWNSGGYVADDFCSTGKVTFTVKAAR